MRLLGLQNSLHSRQPARMIETSHSTCANQHPRWQWPGHGVGWAWSSMAYRGRMTPQLMERRKSRTTRECLNWELSRTQSHMRNTSSRRSAKITTYISFVILSKVHWHTNLGGPITPHFWNTPPTFMAKTTQKSSLRSQGPRARILCPPPRASGPTGQSPTVCTGMSWLAYDNYNASAYTQYCESGTPSYFWYQCPTIFPLILISMSQLLSQSLYLGFINRYVSWTQYWHYFCYMHTILNYWLYQCLHIFGFCETITLDLVFVLGRLN